MKNELQIRTPIMLITGGLGSGKTTLLKNILDAAPVRVAVLMNEFGEIGVDGRIIKGRNVDIVELAGGCVCCSMTGEFEEAVREIITGFRPDMIVVEATGVAEADSLVFEVDDNLPEVRLDTVICVVDAYLSIRHPQVGYTSRTQIGSADIILLNKTDLVTTDEAQTVEEQTRKYNERAAIVQTDYCRVDMEILFGLTGEARPRYTLFPAPEGEAAGNSRPVLHFESFSWTSGRVLDEEKFSAFMGRLPQEVIRAKGFVRFSGSACLVNYVVGRVDFEEFDVASTELVFIGPEVHAVRGHVLKKLEACEVK